jgi:hypothetical protein
MANETVNSLAVKRLYSRVKILFPDKPVSLSNIHFIGIDKFLINDIKACMESENPIDISKGLFFLMGILEKYTFEDLGTEFNKFLVEKIPTLIYKNRSFQSSYFALDLYILLNKNYSDYRDVMLRFLKSDDLGFRKAALGSYETFSQSQEIIPLLDFQNDPYVSELSMCGPLQYELRDIALYKISKILGKNFLINKLEVPDPEWGINAYVSWYDWAPFLSWWETHKTSEGLFSKFFSKFKSHK